MTARFARMLALALVCSARSATAQHGGGAESMTTTAPADARQFAFLVGQFELVVKPAATTLAARIHGVPKMVGTWKGWRIMDGFGYEDELRITDESGNPKSLSHATRYFDAQSKRWMTTGIDAYRGVVTSSTAEWKDNMMQTNSRGTDAEGKPYLSRSRFYDITPTSFKFRQDRSMDDGKTWKEGMLTIDAKRVAASVAR
ncbi:MAG: hypothetical protein V4550_08310 [Gemmatimonadota bacterium]